MLAIIVLGTSGGDILISSGMKQLGEISLARLQPFGRFIKEVLSDVRLIGGMMSMAASYAALMLVLSRAQLSFVIPVMSLSYVTSTLGAKFILREHITKLRWLGTAIICAGVALISIE